MAVNSVLTAINASKVAAQQAQNTKPIGPQYMGISPDTTSQVDKDLKPETFLRIMGEMCSNQSLEGMDEKEMMGWMTQMQNMSQTQKMGEAINRLVTHQQETTLQEQLRVATSKKGQIVALEPSEKDAKTMGKIAFYKALNEDNLSESEAQKVGQKAELEALRSKVGKVLHARAEQGKVMLLIEEKSAEKRVDSNGKEIKNIIKVPFSSVIEMGTEEDLASLASKLTDREDLIKNKTEKVNPQIPNLPTAKQELINKFTEDLTNRISGSIRQLISSN